MSWLSALGRSTYRRVWTVYGLQQFGYWFSSIAFQWLVARETDSDPLSLSLLYFCILLPMLLVSLPAGVLADTHDRRRIVLGAQLAIVVISGATAALVLAGRAPVPVLMACAFAVGTAHSVAQPSQQALLATAVPPGELRSAVLLQAIAMNLARTAGPAIAGVLILAWDAVESLLAYGAIGLVALLVLVFTRAPARSRAATDGGRLPARIASGLRHARSHQPAGTALAIVAVTALFAVSYVAQLPAIAQRVSADPRTFLLFTTTGGVGSLIGVLLVAARPPSVPSVTPPAVMMGALGLVVVALGVSRHLVVTYVLVGAAGALTFGVMTVCNNVIQQVVDDDHRGRVMSLYMACWGGFLPVGGLILGSVWHFTGPVAALTLNGCVAVAFALWVLRPGAVRSAQTASASGHGAPSMSSLR